MSDHYKSPEMVEPRSNPSEAEKGRKLTKGEVIKYRSIFTLGILLMIGGPVVIALLATGYIPFKYQFLFVIALFGFFVGLILTDIGVTKGRDKRHHRGFD